MRPAPASTVEAPAAAPGPPQGRVAEPRRLAINFLFLSGGEFTAKVLTFASFSYLARQLGAWHYGLLEFTLAIMVFFTLPVDLGLGSYGAREIARNPKSADRLLHEITGLRLLLALVSMLGLGIFIAVIHKSIELKMLLGFYGLSLLGGPFLLQWFFQAHDQMQWVGIASIVRQAGFAALVFLFCDGKASIVWIGMVECASVAAVAAFCVFTIRRKMHFPWPWPELRLSRLTGHLREASPIGLTELAWAFMWYFCTVLLGFVFSDASLGWFGASHRALMALHTFVWLYFFNLLPSISRCVGLPIRHLMELMDRSIRFAAWAGLFAVGVLSALAPLLLTMIYGPAFRAATSSFSVLAWMLPVAMLSGHHRYILIAYNQQKTLLACTTCSAIAAVILGFLLVPWYGGVGAAWALLIANLTNFGLVYLAVRRSVARVTVRRQLASPLAAFSFASFAYFATVRWNPWVALGAALVLYSSCLVWIEGRDLSGFVLSLLRKPVASEA
jgi:O-antigen/teichoic acid export membrane protein